MAYTFRKVGDLDTGRANPALAYNEDDDCYYYFGGSNPANWSGLTDDPVLYKINRVSGLRTPVTTITDGVQCVNGAALIRDGKFVAVGFDQIVINANVTSTLYKTTIPLTNTPSEILAATAQTNALGVGGSVVTVYMSNAFTYSNKITVLFGGTHVKIDYDQNRFYVVTTYPEFNKINSKFYYENNIQQFINFYTTNLTFWSNGSINTKDVTVPNIFFGHLINGTFSSDYLTCYHPDPYADTLMYRREVVFRKSDYSQYSTNQYIETGYSERLESTNKTLATLLTNTQGQIKLYKHSMVSGSIPDDQRFSNTSISTTTYSNATGNIYETNFTTPTASVPIPTSISNGSGYVSTGQIIGFAGGVGAEGGAELWEMDTEQTATPTGFTTEIVVNESTSARNIKLTWNKVTGVTYQLFRRQQTSTTWTQVGSNSIGTEVSGDPTKLEYIDTAVNARTTTYHYKLRGITT